jgi:hypothetical protein
MTLTCERCGYHETAVAAQHICYEYFMDLPLSDAVAYCPRCPVDDDPRDDSGLWLVSWAD